ncbi:hypothetical protein ALP39_200330 [Pseudomonas marginalis pv. marginalis]|jgi:hypothetical protein|nr:hypothetical protein ALP39_200330 [Pseudomonas marginalis pv. marginalis]VVN19204.1 hypothetical protein PS664_04212 [Pseudomonas fluorescens]
MATPLTKSSDLTANNYKKAQVVALNEHVEEDVTLLIEGTLVNCLISYCPYDIEVGRTYNVELTLNISEDYEIAKTEPRALLTEKIDCGYAYFLYGVLHDDNFLTFTLLKDEGIHYDHPELNEKFIKLRVERIDASFQ